MGTVIIAMNNAAVAVAAAHRGAAVPPLTAEALWTPIWVLVGGVLFALVIALLMLGSLRTALAHQPKSRDKDFTRMLCDQVWTHMDTMSGIFTQRMRQQPGALEQLRIMVRNLREDLSAPINFVDQMRSHPAASWPSYELFTAFNNWGGQLKSMELQLGDLQHEMTYPVTKDPVDKNRDAILVYHYLTEQQVLARAVDKLRGFAVDICAAGKAHLEKEGKSLWGKHDDEDGHHDCPCCKRLPDRHNKPEIEALPPLPPLPVAAPKPPPPPAKTACCCAVPRMCVCTQGCACSCTCQATPPAKADAH